MVAVAVAGCGGSSGGSSNAASSPAAPGSVGGSSQGHTSAQVVTPAASGTYLSDLKPSGNLSEQVNSGPVKIAGSI